MVSLSTDETFSTSIDSTTPSTIDRHLFVSINTNISMHVYRSSLLHCVLMIYDITKLRLDINWGQCNLILGEVYRYLVYFMSFIKCFQKVFIGSIMR